MIGALILC